MRGRDVMVVAGWLALMAAVLVQAGPLSPPAGPVASTYKTLSQVDPGTPLESVPPGQGAQHLITQPGRYYLTGNMTGVAGQHGIAVYAPNVTIDLCGFLLDGGGVGLSGIVDVGNVGHGTVMNGTLGGWTTYAVYSPGIDWVCRDLCVYGGGSGGINLNIRSVVENCQVAMSQGKGVSVGTVSRVVRSSVGQHPLGGIFAGNGTRVESCIVESNGEVGIYGAVGVTVSDCTVGWTYPYNGLAGGIYVAKNGIVERCVVQACSGHGVYSNEGGTIVRGCKIDSNAGDGINVFNSSLVEDNEVHANGSIVGGATTAAGIRVRGSTTRVQGNHLVSNNTAVKIEGIGNLVARNSFSGNVAHVAGGAGNSVAQIIQAPANGFVSTDPNANINY